MKEGMSKVKVGGVTLCAIFVFAAVSFSAFAVGDEPPPISEPEAMNLTAEPASIYVSGDTSAITATVYNNTNYTEPIPNVVVWFNTSLGGITYLSSQGGNVAPDECWAITNDSGMAMAVLTSGLEDGMAIVKAVVLGTDVNETVVVELKKPEYGVAVIADNQTKEGESNENVTYYIEVINIGTGADSYTLNITYSEAEFAALNKTEVNISGGGSEEVELNVSSRVRMLPCEQ
jgi:hypothetical protein